MRESLVIINPIKQQSIVQVPGAKPFFIVLMKSFWPFVCKNQGLYLPHEKKRILGVTRTDLVDLPQIYKIRFIQPLCFDIILHTEICHWCLLNVGGQNLRYRCETCLLVVWGCYITIWLDLALGPKMNYHVLSKLKFFLEYSFCINFNSKVISCISFFTFSAAAT